MSVTILTDCQVLVRRLKEGNAVDRVESEVHLNGHLSSIDYVCITEVPRQVVQAAHED
ncbi:unnamed protein product [Camellia sinensis]